MELPNIILLSQYHGNFENYLDAVYQIFKKDFIDNKPVFQGIRLGLKRLPIVDGRECTFYHFTHEGPDESERIPNLRRLERIPFPKPMIENSNNGYLKVWRNQRGSKNRILIFHEAESYLVVLDDKGSYILPWTAYLVEEPHRRRKLLAEYENWSKMQKSLGNT